MAEVGGGHPRTAKSLCGETHESISVTSGGPGGVRRPLREHTRADAQARASGMEPQHRVHLEAALLPIGQALRQLPEAEATASRSPRSLPDLSAP